MASDPKAIFKELKTGKLPKPAVPDKELDELVKDIFKQARDHRNTLVKFYIWYTAILSGLVMVLIFWQAATRLLVFGKEEIELIPQWALNLIVVGMFAEFIGLLTIVTKKVWEFKPFLDHAESKSSKNM